MYGMTPMGVFFTAIFPLVINGQALCQQPQNVPKLRGACQRRNTPLLSGPPQSRMALWGEEEQRSE